MAGAAAAADRRECGRPGADLALGAQFALGCLAAPAGPTRDVRYSVLALAWSVVAVGFAVASESAREQLADEPAALRSMAMLVAPSVPPGEILLRSAVRPERCWMSTARASCAAWGEEVGGPAVIVQPDRRAARNCGDVRPVRGCSIA